MIYLDNAATTQISQEVFDAMTPYLKDEYGNPGAIHGLGRKAANAVAKAREQVARLINCEPGQVVFTSGGSEANNLVFSGLRNYLSENNKKHIITSAVEHDSVLKAVKNMCVKDGFDSTYLGVDRNCVVSSSELETKLSLSGNVGLVSVMYVNNEVGSVNPVNGIGELCAQNNILFHTDGVQAMGFEEINVREIGCDFLSVSSHKTHGPKGVGALFIKNPSIMSPIIFGGDEQEFGIRGGTENVAGIVGFGEACEIAAKNFGTNRNKSINLKQDFEEELLFRFQKEGLGDILHFNSTYEGSKISNIRLENIDAQTLLLALDTKGVCVSAGSACSSHNAKPSHVLMAMGLSEDEARDSIRVSFSHMQSPGEIIIAAKKIVECVLILRGEEL